MPLERNTRRKKKNPCLKIEHNIAKKKEKEKKGKTRRLSKNF